VRRLVVVEFLSLDGVMQAPGDPFEDPEGGFAHGGWQAPYFDESLMAAGQEGQAGTDAYLFGRKTYEIMARYWPGAPSDDPFAAHLNETVKYVASRKHPTLTWQNSQLIEGDVTEEVAALKAQDGEDIVVLGSGDLVQTLIAGDLVDRYSLTISPIVLGSGKRLFRNRDQPVRLDLVESHTATTGSLVLTYEPVR
jgi:dihydrofolate reductase